MRDHDLEPDTIETYYSEEGGYEAALQAFAGTPGQRPSSPAPTSPHSECCAPPKSTACESRRI